MVTWAEVVQLASSLPEVEESTSYRKPALKVGGKTFAGLSPHEEGALAVRIGRDEREFLLHANPDAFFVTPHYESSPWLLVRLNAVQREELRDVLAEAWLLRAPARLAASFDENRGDPQS